MTQEHVCKIIFGVLFLIFMLIRIYYAKKIRGNVNIRTEGGKREQFLVFLVSIGMMIIPIIWIFSGLFQMTNMDLPSYARITGIITAILSLWLFYEVHKALGRNWSPVLEIREGHTLTKEGPYKRIRHPMYTQIWIWVIAQFLITSNWTVGLFGLISWSILYFIRVPKEEKMMKEAFGEAYLKYMEQTGKILPKF
jgi:protein-S-isoprenylcysteine O-methyltransferase Ste14